MRSAVLDVGTGFTKAGFSGEEAPREVFRSCVGQPRHPGTRATLYGHAADIVAGDEAYADRGLLDMRWPVQQGHVTDFSQFESLLYYSLFNRLSVAPDVTPLLMLEPADQTRESREKVAEILFETFNIPLMGTLNTATSTVYSTGRTTGLVVDSGAGKTMISAVCEGYCLSHSMRPSPLAGNRLTDELFAFLRSRGYPMSVQADWELANTMKEALCRASTTASAAGGASESDEDTQQTEDARTAGAYPGKNEGGAYYALPDGERVFLLEAETQLAERLFHPSTTLVHGNESSHSAAGVEGEEGEEAPQTPTGYTRSNPTARTFKGLGWTDTICDVIASCPAPATRAELYSSVILGGGTTMLRDVERRLQRELSERVGSTTSGGSSAGAAMGGEETVPKVVAFPHRAQAAWIGGSVWACSATFPGMCLSKADYYEGGAGSVHKHAF